MRIPPMPQRRPLVAGLVLVLASLGAVAAAPTPDELRTRYSELLARQQQLERERTIQARIEELSAEDSPWLALDLAASELHIVVRVTVVLTLPLESVTVEGEKSMFGAKPPPPGWADGILDLFGKSGPRLEPEKIQPKDPGAPEEDPASLTPEKLGLTEKQLTQARAFFAERLLSHLRNTRESFADHKAKPSNPALKKRYDDNLQDLRKFIEPGQPYCAMARQIVREVLPGTNV